MLSDTGAYGNHAPACMFHGCSESVALYNAARTSGSMREAVYTNNLPVGRVPRLRAGPGDLRHRVARWTSSPRELGIDPFELRRHQRGAPGRPARGDARGGRPTSASASYGLDQCLDLAQAALARGNGVARPPATDWRVGEGMASR